MTLSWPLKKVNICTSLQTKIMSIHRRALLTVWIRISSYLATKAKYMNWVLGLKWDYNCSSYPFNFNFFMLNYIFIDYKYKYIFRHTFNMLLSSSLFWGSAAFIFPWGDRIWALLSLQRKIKVFSVCVIFSLFILWKLLIEIFYSVECIIFWSFQNKR